MSRSTPPGLVCLTGGDEGPLASALARGGYDAGPSRVERLVHIFGPRMSTLKCNAISIAKRSIATRQRCALRRRCVFRCWPPMA